MGPPADTIRRRRRVQATSLWFAPLAGGLAACGFAPLSLWPLALLGFAWLLAVLGRARTGRRAAALGWLFGVGHFTVGNYWIATAFTYQAAMPAWLGSIAVVGLSLYLAVFPAVALLLAWLVAGSRKDKSSLAVLAPALAGAWIVGEWLRGWVCTGFPWNPLGAVTLGPFARPGLASIAPWLGSYALGGVVVLLAAGWLFAVERRRADLPTLLTLVGPTALMLVPFPHGGNRAAPAGLPFTLVQPNWPQPDLNDPSKFEINFQKIAGLSRPLDPADHRLLLWPESGVPDYLRPGYPQRAYDETTYMGDPTEARARIGRLIGPNTLLLTGATDLVMHGRRIAAARNTMTALDGTGAIRGSYAKAHLVPYGEYLPMRGLLEPLGLARLVPGDLDFEPGPGPRTIDFGDPAKGGWGRVAFQICYEIVFPGAVIDEAHRPDFLFNGSNDGWFGAWGPPQHLAQARLRAIEEGVPILRATTTGISAVIDADGFVRQSLPQGVAGRIDGRVPPVHAPTLFARLGNLLSLGWAAAFLGLAVVASRRRRR